MLILNSWQRPIFWIAAAGAAVIGIGAIVVFNSSSGNGADPDNPEQVALGKAVYTQNCAACHGANLEGQANWRVRKPDGKLPAPPHNEEGHSWHHADQILFDITKNGLKPPVAPEGYKTDMPAFEGVLSDSEIWAILAFFKNSWSPRARARNKRLTEAYKKQ